ncbi:ABC transporter substrate-binding protein [Lamprobacter modestohalophilus]|uniref:ABC transporter substrate-binding protein n=1 Tax=Lamprobacter modestohalophilus TaxID=1064514 RepID=A0A9X0W9S5_9GAMM|nr:amino acid ABC transporter substrate-binding protein [Lamprobacter modestohalophilus]MBK1619421.1 ABC transporter substrate-binding protein [Lamprobacter modestohalophilus]
MQLATYRPLGRLLALLLALLLMPLAAAADQLDEVRERGLLRCGVNGEIPGLSYRDDDGDWSGIDVDLCRAVAAAALGSADKVKLIPLTTAERFDALRDGKIDLLARNTTWNQARDLTQGVSFAAILYYDGQGFMVPRSTNTLSTLELGGSQICAIADTTSIDSAKRYFQRHQMPMELKQYPDLKGATKAYLEGECTTLTGDRSQLYALRARLEQPESQRILPEVISRDPLSPAVVKGETRMLDLVRWTLYTLVNAEEMGISSDNVATAKARAQTDAVRTLLDLDGESAEVLGIEPEWGYRVILAVGNYAELFERNLGKASGLNIKRGLNALWTQGGLLYAPPPR